MQKGRVKMEGILYFSRSERHIMEKMVDEGHLHCDVLYTLEDVDDKGKRKPEFESYSYILVNSDLYRIHVFKEDIEEGEKFRDGQKVSFETPIVQKGKYKWAYNIIPLD